MGITRLGANRIAIELPGMSDPDRALALIKKAGRLEFKLVDEDAKDLDKKSTLVYLLPLLALVYIGLAVMGLKSNIAVIVMAVSSGAIGIGGLYNLMTVDLSNLAVKISIEQGLWQTMYGYLLICVLSVIWVVLDVLGGRKKT